MYDLKRGKLKLIEIEKLFGKSNRVMLRGSLRAKKREMGKFERKFESKRGKLSKVEEN